MTESLSTLLAGIIDYAGLFPPAGLDMPNAVAEYERHLREDQIGMLAGFVCPAARLNELANCAGDRTWQLAALGPTSDAPRESLDQLILDLDYIDSFLDSHLGFSVSALELRVPRVISDPGDLDHFLRGAEDRVSRCRHVPKKLFYELGWPTHWGSALQVLKQGRMFRGAKVRTGGLNAAAFPSPAQVAAFLAAAAEHQIPWKATAGLHHPLRRFQVEVRTKMHGFLNVFLGSALAWKGVEESVLVAFLSEEDAGAFQFGDESITWRDHVLDRELLSRMRANFALSFGSCSYQEPIDDLKDLNLL